MPASFFIPSIPSSWVTTFIANERLWASITSSLWGRNMSHLRQEDGQRQRGRWSRVEGRNYEVMKEKIEKMERVFFLHTHIDTHTHTLLAFCILKQMCKVTVKVIFEALFLGLCVKWVERKLEKVCVSVCLCCLLILPIELMQYNIFTSLYRPQILIQPSYCTCFTCSFLFNIYLKRLASNINGFRCHHAWGI